MRQGYNTYDMSTRYNMAVGSSREAMDEAAWHRCERLWNCDQPQRMTGGERLARVLRRMVQGIRAGHVGTVRANARFVVSHKD